jgi:hypothetical protein
MFITAFTRAPQLPLSLTRVIQSVPFYPMSPRSILILSTHLRLGLPSLFPTNNLYAFPFSPSRSVCPAHLIILDLIIIIILGEEYKPWSFLLCSFRRCVLKYRIIDKEYSKEANEVYLRYFQERLLGFRIKHIY